MEDKTRTTILQKLAAVQINLKAPKSKTNNFGKYNYRSCEDILEAVKPLLNAAGLILLINDEITFIEGRFYVKATATVYDTETSESLYCSAYAREADTKSGMDAAQVTGACSSYARKYALNALLCIDDTKDADTDEHATEAQARAKTGTVKKQEAKAQAKNTESGPAGTMPEEFPERKQLREIIKQRSLDGHKIAAECNLGPESTREDYKKALAYAKKEAEAQARLAYAEELAAAELNAGEPEEPNDDTQGGT